MKNKKLEQLLASIKTATKQISQLTPTEKAALEKEWDVAHAYYSSVLAGSNLDRKDFEDLATKIN